tara:strand:+ start:130 stop:555 length:426 start_codon:yes stop_codon:yes gene_type:complete
MGDKEFKKINENWEKFLNEEIENLPEKQQLDEAIATAALIAKLIYVLSQKDNIRKITDALLTRNELPDSARKILETINLAVDVVEKELPSAARKTVELRGKAPDSWVGNALTSLFAASIKKMSPEEIGIISDEDMEELSPE